MKATYELGTAALVVPKIRTVGIVQFTKDLLVLSQFRDQLPVGQDRIFVFEIQLAGSEKPMRYYDADAEVLKAEREKLLKSIEAYYIL
jgi:hypothetical protein